MPSRTDPPTIWPAGWPSFSPKDKDKSSSEELRLNLKREIIAEYGEESLTKAWLKTCDALRQVTSSIAEAGSAYIPAFEFKDVVGPDNSDILEEMKAKGGFIIRNVIPRAIADQLFKEQVEFIANNDEIRAWPAENPAIFNIHNGPVQLQLRTHPNQLKLQRLLNSLFTDSKCTTPDESMKQSEPVLYPDALRIRQPGQEFLGLGPHIDAGSLSRWADPDYRKTYHKILAGDPEHFDPYDLSHRRDAKPGMFPSGVHGTTLRTFQGWTALTPCGPGEGGLLLVPDVQVVTAYWMLRPFFKSPDDGDWEDPARWTLDDTAWFPGTFAWDSQLLSPVSHPNLRLEETLVNVPRVLPGDTVWWHCDMTHAVATTHTGTEPAAVVYIPSAPSTPANKDYIRRYWVELQQGIPPEDYKLQDGVAGEQVPMTQNERLMKGALNLDLISPEGRRGLGEDGQNPFDIDGGTVFNRGLRIP